MPEQTSQTRQQRQRQREQVLIAWADALMSTTSHYLVKGILPRTGLAVVWGPPKCGKSFWTFDVTVHIALGREYRGRPVRQGTVVYCALEGGGGFGNRIEAWRRQHLGNGGEENVPFYLIKQPFDLIANHQKLITAIRDELGKAAPAVIVIDTLNRALVGDENKSDDMAKFIKALGAVQAAFDCLVLVVHHCGVVGTRPRGHTSLAGADDAQIRIERAKDGTIKAIVEHAKDFEAGAVLASTLEQVELGTDGDGDMITSCVITAVEAKKDEHDEQADASGRKVPKGAQLALEILRKLMASAIDTIAAPEEAGLPHGSRICRAERWREYFYKASPIENQSSKQKAYRRAHEQLVEMKIVDIWDQYVWLVPEQTNQPGQTDMPDIPF